MKSNYSLNLKNNRYLDSYTNKTIFKILYFIPYLNKWFRDKIVKTYYFKLKTKYEK